MTDENKTSTSENLKNEKNDIKNEGNSDKKESAGTEEDPDVLVLCDGGVKKKITKEGDGEIPPHGSKVSVHYVGTLEDGTKFDSSRDRNEPIEFKLGVGNVIKAWDHGIATMKAGERAILTCRSDFAYGERGSPPKIPPNATLIFDVEVISFKEDVSDITDDGGIIKKEIRKGEGWKKPSDSSVCVVKYTGEANGKVFTTHDPEDEVVLNLDEDLAMIDGLCLSLQNMVKGSKARFQVRSDYAYGSKGHNELGIPPDTDLTYYIELISFENEKDTWDMNTSEKLEAMLKRKNKGNTLFKMKKYSKAIKFYEKTANTISEAQEKKLRYQHREQLHSIQVACHSNTALCHFKKKEYIDAIASCNKALAIEPNHVKSLFRRGQTYAYNGDNEEALEDLKAAHELNPDDKQIKNLLGIVRKRVKKEKNKQKKHFAGFFNKVSLVEDKPGSPEEGAQNPEENSTKSSLDDEKVESEKVESEKVESEKVEKKEEM